MVGIPGRSKGCITCRRRKIRCDETHPDCNRCVKSGRQCEGYETYPTFLNQTVHGPQKRFGLEEAKPRQPGQSESSSAALSRRSSACSSNRTQTTKRRLTRKKASSRLSRQPSNTELVDVQLIAHFWESYVPANDSAQTITHCEWLRQAIDAPTPTVALQLSLKALAFTRLGYTRNNVALQNRGHLLYGSALQELQKALYDQDAMWLDETLAAAHSLSVYELFENTTTSITGWNSHMTGMGLLIRLRGPNRHQKPLGRAVLETFRYSCMIQCIQYRRSSFMLEESWQTIASDLGDRIVHMKFVDSGFALAAIQAELDQKGLRTGEFPPDEAGYYYQRLEELDTQLDVKYSNFAELSSSPLFWVSDDITYSGASGTTFIPALQPLEPPIAFPSLSTAVSVNLYWSLKICIMATARQVTNSARKHPIPVSTYPSPPRPADQDPPSPESKLQQQQSRSASPSPPATAAFVSNLFASESNLPVQYLTLILRGMPYVLSPQQNTLGPQRSLFPLRVALFLLRLFPVREADNPLMQWCKQMYTFMDKSKGIHYAREVAKTDGGHAASGNERYLAGGVTPAASPGPMPRAGPYDVGGAEEEERGDEF